MKRRFALLALLILLPVAILFDNPIFVPYINEFVIMQGGEWTLETLLPNQHSMDGWALVSGQDTGYFKKGMTVGPGAILFTRADLEPPILFSRVSNEILVRSPMGTVAMLSYGTPPADMIAFPAFGQSICYNQAEGFYYLDNSPTLGLANDTLNGMGDLSGIVTDTLGTPLADVTVTYHDWVGRTVTTDAAGVFHIHDYAKAQQLYFARTGYNGTGTTVQMRPDSTIALTVKLSPVVSVSEISAPLPDRMRLLPGYPNPFNPQTTIELQLPTSERVELTIHSAVGAKVAELVSGPLPAGIHRFHWRPDGLASGVYFCRAAGKEVIVTKLLYLR